MILYLRNELLQIPRMNTSAFVAVFSIFGYLENCVVEVSFYLDSQFLYFLVDPGIPTVQEQLCYFCDKAANKEDGQLHLVSSFHLDECVRKCAEILGKPFLPAKLLKGDMIAQDAMHHRNCLTDLYKKANAAQLDGNYSDSKRQLHGIAFSEVVTYIEEMTLYIPEKKFIFKLSDLSKLYYQRLKELGMEVQGNIHSTRLKNQILSHFPVMNSYADGREILLAFNADIGEVLGISLSTNYDDEGYILAEAAKIVQR